MFSAPLNKDFCLMAMEAESADRGSIDLQYEPERQCQSARSGRQESHE